MNHTIRRAYIVACSRIYIFKCWDWRSRPCIHWHSRFMIPASALWKPPAATRGHWSTWVFHKWSQNIRLWLPSRSCSTTYPPIFLSVVHIEMTFKHMAGITIATYLSAMTFLQSHQRARVLIYSRLYWQQHCSSQVTLEEHTAAIIEYKWSIKIKEGSPNITPNVQ